MLFFHKRKEVVKINSKYKIGQDVRFKYSNDSYIGIIRSVRDKNGRIVYDIIVGGECPFEATGINEENINLYVSRKFK